MTGICKYQGKHLSVASSSQSKAAVRMYNLFLKAPTSSPQMINKWEEGQCTDTAKGATMYQQVVLSEKSFPGSLTDSFPMAINSSSTNSHK